MTSSVTSFAPEASLRRDLRAASLRGIASVYGATANELADELDLAQLSESLYKIESLLEQEVLPRMRHAYGSQALIANQLKARSAVGVSVVRTGYCQRTKAAVEDKQLRRDMAKFALEKVESLWNAAACGVAAGFCPDLAELNQSLRLVNIRKACTEMEKVDQVGLQSLAENVTLPYRRHVMETAFLFIACIDLCGQQRGGAWTDFWNDPVWGEEDLGARRASFWDGQLPWQDAGIAEGDLPEYLPVLRQSFGYLARQSAIFRQSWPGYAGEDGYRSQLMRVLESSANSEELIKEARGLAARVMKESEYAREQLGV